MTYNGQLALVLLRLGARIGGTGSGGDGGTCLREGYEETIRHIVLGRE